MLGVVVELGFVVVLVVLAVLEGKRDADSTEVVTGAFSGNDGSAF